MQRVPLIRHNLHSAVRSNDFTFFKTLQVRAFTTGTNYVAYLSEIHDDADSILHSLDDLNMGLVYLHQQAFKTVYENVRTNAADREKTRQALVRVDIAQQKQVAEMSIDKILNAVTALIEQQPEHCREVVTNIWMVGVTIVVDSVQTCLMALNALESVDDDFIMLEYLKQDVQCAVEVACTALKGVLNLMSSSPEPIFYTPKHRTSSVGSESSSWLARLSTILSPGSGFGSSPQLFRKSFSFGVPGNIRGSISSLGQVPTSPMNINAPEPSPSMVEKGFGGIKSVCAADRESIASEASTRSASGRSSKWFSADSETSGQPRGIARSGDSQSHSNSNTRNMGSERGGPWSTDCKDITSAKRYASPVSLESIEV